MADFVIEDVPLQNRTLTHVLRHNLEHNPDRVALSDDRIELTYAEVWNRACVFAGGLRCLGVGVGDSVLVMLDNSVDYFVAVAAVSFLGAISVPTNTAYKGRILEHVIANSECSFALVEAHYLATVERADSDRIKAIVIRRDSMSDDLTQVPPSKRHVQWADVTRASAIEPVDAGPWDTLALMYTSGTTGLSKGAISTHAMAFGVAFMPDVQGPHDHNDVLLVVCPMFHVTGLYCGAFAAMTVGASAHIVSGFSASGFWDDVKRVGATSSLLVGAMVEFLMNQPRRNDDRTHTLRKVWLLPRSERIRAFMDRFGVITTTAFGSTESSCFITNIDPDVARLNSVGRPRAGFTVRLVDEHDVEVPDGQVGEVVVRPDHPWTMAPGMVNDLPATLALWRNGWFHTGDLLRRDAEGWYYFVDRAKDCIRRRGENISSVEVEREVLSHPAVRECAAVGVGDPRIDQEVKVAVILRDDASLSEADLVTFLIEQLPYYAVPRYVSFVDDLPRTPTGKVRKAELTELVPGTWDREEAGIAVSRPGRT